MKKKSVLGLIWVALLFGGCTSKEENPAINNSLISKTEIKVTKSAQTITGVSGTKFQLDLPSGWEELPDIRALNPDNDFILTDSLETKFLAAVVESKQDFVDIETYLDLLKESLEDSFEIEVVFHPITEKSGYFMDFPAAVDGLNVHYLYYVLATEEHYVQLYGWTIESLYDSSKDDLTEIMDSFEEL